MEQNLVKSKMPNLESYKKFFTLENILLFILIPLTGFVVDFITKQFVIYNICFTNTDVNVLPFFNIVCTLNTGVSFGMFADITNGKFILLAITVFIVFFVYYLMYKESEKYTKYSYSLIIAGAFGNIIDRALHSGVIDFFDFFYSTYHYPAFNVADSLIFIGIFGIAVLSFFNKKKANSDSK